MRRLHSLWLLPLALLVAVQRHEHNEAYWANVLAQRLGARQEVRLDDGTRVDLLMPHFAIELDWPEKWAEGVGQALYYGLKTKRTPVLILLIEDRQHEQRYIDRAKLVCRKYRIRLFTFDTDAQRLADELRKEML